MLGWKRLRVQKAPLWFRDWAAEFSRGFDPLADHHLHVGDRLRIGSTVRGTPRKLWYFRDEGLIFLAPVDDDFVAVFRLHGSSPASLYFKIT